MTDEWTDGQTPHDGIGRAILLLLLELFILQCYHHNSCGAPHFTKFMMMIIIIIIVHLWCAYYKKDIGALQSQRWVKSMNKRLTNIKCRTEKVSFKMFPKDCRVWFRRFKNKIQNIFCGGNTVLPQTTFHLGGKLLIKTPPNPTTSWPSYCRIPDIKSYVHILYKICSFK